MSVPKVDIRAYLSVDADALLEAMATASNSTKADMVALLLEEAILGRGHAIKVAAARLASSGKVRNISE